MTVVIRRVEPNDYKALYQVYSSPQVIWGTLQLPFPSEEIWRRRLEDTSDEIFMLVACIDDEVVGQLNIHTFPNRPRRKHAGNIGMAVRDDLQGQGVGTELMRAAVDAADNWLNLLRLELTVFVDNEPAIRLYKNNGFVVEGTLSQYAFRAGQYIDVYAMARIRQS